MRQIKEKCFCGRSLNVYEHGRNKHKLVCWECSNHFKPNGMIININIDGREVFVGKHNINFDEVNF